MISLSVITSAPTPYFGYVSKQAATAVAFPQRLAERRKHHSLTQQQLAGRIGILKHEARRYESVPANGERK